MPNQKPKIGDIYEIKMPSGLAYVQYTHETEDGTHLIRVLPGIYSSRPYDLVALSQQKELYFIFTVLTHALRKKELALISNQPIPEWAKPFPIMRKPGGRERGGKILNWCIGHGLRLNTIKDIQQALHVRELTPEQKKLSVAQIWPVSTLAMEIERGWLPERNEEFEEADRQKAILREGQVQKIEARVIDHYFYFPKRDNAERAAKQLRTKGWSVETKVAADGKNWFVLAKQPAPLEKAIEDIRDELEHLADQFNGEYDGWGAAI